MWANKKRVVHDAQMKVWIPPLVGPSWPLHHFMLTEENEGQMEVDEWVVEKVLKHRRKPDGNWEFLTRWKGYKPEDDTWEPASNFLQKVNILWLDYCKKNGIDFTVMEHLKGLLKEQTHKA